MSSLTRDERLVTALLRKQAELGLSQRTMARLMGISRSLLCHTINGRKRVSRTLLMGISRNFPDLEPEVFTFLRDATDPDAPTLVPGTDEVQ